MPADNGFAARRARDNRYDRLGGESSTADYAESSADSYAASYAESYAESSIADATNEHAAPRWGPPDASTGALSDAPADTRTDRPDDGRLRALWWQVTTRFRRPRLALAAIAGVLALCLALGAAALGSAFLHGAPDSAHGVLGAKTATGVASPSAGHATPGATTAPATNTAATATTTTNTTVAPTNTRPPTTLILTFTCASGVAGGTGKICVHTLPSAALSLTVRYSDGSPAKGKTFHGVSAADGSGNYTWSWSVTSGSAGPATATVTATLAGQTVTKSTTFTVTG